MHTRSSHFRFVPALICLGLAALWAASVARAATPLDHGPFDRLLKATVRNERVDYLEIRSRHWPELGAYLDTLARVEPLDLGLRDRLAYYIDLYNATMIRAVVERLRSGYSVSEKDHAIFDEPLVRMGGRTLSLNQLENQRIRVEFKDPRIHVALVCAAVSCPPLLDRAYTGFNLEEVLDAKMRAFVADRRRNEIDMAGRTLRLSQIFNWYSQDFEAKGGVLAYFDSMHPGNFAGWKLEYLDYDWSLNIAPPVRGTWIRVTDDLAPLHAGATSATNLGSARKDELFEVLEEHPSALRIERPFGAGDAWIARSQTARYPPVKP